MKKLFLPVTVVIGVNDSVEFLLELQRDTHEAGRAVERGLGLVEHDGGRDLVQLLDGPVQKTKGRKAVALVRDRDGL
jgi:hypothetical protein